MATAPWDAEGEAQAALRVIVADPRYGPSALSNAQTMTNLLKDMLPDMPRESSVLVAASDADVVGTLQTHVSQGMDVVTASRLASGSLENRKALTPEACAWAVGALAAALDLDAAGGTTWVATEPVRSSRPAPTPVGDTERPARADQPTAVPERTKVPAMPRIGSGGQVTGITHPLVDGISPTIGWQFRPPDKGGPAFVIIRRSAFGSLKVVESYPLTEDGWSSAWQSLMAQDPAAVAKVLAALKVRKAERAKVKGTAAARETTAAARETTAAARETTAAARETTTVKDSAAEGIQRGQSSGPTSPVEELTKLADLLEKGLLTREEFEVIKARLMDLRA